MDFLFFDELQKKPYLVLALIVASSIASLLLNVYGLRLGITYVLPHLLYIPIILTVYYYPRHAVFSSPLSSLPVTVPSRSSSSPRHQLKYSLRSHVPAYSSWSLGWYHS